MIRNLFPNTELYRDAATLATGTGMAQLIPILASPVLTRIFTPAEFGVLGAFAAFCTIVVSFATGRYELAILLPEREDRARHVTWLSIMLTFAVSLATLLAIVLFKEPLNDLMVLLDTEELGNLMYWAPACIASIGLYQVFSYQLNRHKRYGTIAASKFSQAAGMTGAQLGFGFLGMGAAGLVIGRVIGDLFSWIWSGADLLRRKLLLPETFSRDTFREVAKRYENFPKVNAPHALTNASSSQLPQILLLSFFSKTINGHYNLTYKVCFAPVQLVSSSVGQVFSRRVTEKYQQEEDIHAFTKKIAGQLALVALLPFGLLALFAPPLFEFVFGAQWTVAGQYTQVLAPYFYMVFVVSPLVYIPNMLDRQKKAFAIEIAYLVLRLAALFLGIWLADAWLAVAFYGVAGIIIQGYLLFWILKLGREAYD
ncbi:MAG: oligosaccharide flippase family protein [Balneolaceae bacterium]|nr:oligosaccharide flippase family protein [Balneolaceae bacterium]